MNAEELRLLVGLRIAARAVLASGVRPLGVHGVDVRFPGQSPRSVGPVTLGSRIIDLEAILLSRFRRNAWPQMRRAT